MTTVLSQKGQIVLPEPVRRKLQLLPGDDFEVAIEDEETITLRRVTQPANRGLVDLLLACPSPFEIPAREVDDSAAPAGKS
jgi:AbrB family looped-hinge helix DNA binding protein